MYELFILRKCSSEREQRGGDIVKQADPFRSTGPVINDSCIRSEGERKREGRRERESAGPIRTAVGERSHNLDNAACAWL